MTSISRIGLPERAGLIMVGGTLGAVVFGAGRDSFSTLTCFGAIIGAALAMCLAMVPWSRLIQLASSPHAHPGK